ncbi:MAG TPA: GNAT family N-acetyltransferase [Paracoccaceae bacterium]|nr:GNAT family N-acetyltransferase [Paracoccaceae bacterium]HMO70871.1 GNAT family N-acetyltransferase [Paracoccaceae bacterium]
MIPAIPCPVLQSPRLVLRPLAFRDFDAFAALHASPHAALLWGLPSRDAAWARMLALAGEWPVRGFGTWALADRWSDAFVGHVGFIQPHDAAEPQMTWALVADGQGRGLAEEGARAARDWGRAHGIARPVSHIDAKNLPSIRLAERLGAVREGSTTFAPGALMLHYRHPGPLA